jgi:hypothetical protein
MRRKYLAVPAMAVALAAAIAGGCASDKSFALVAVTSADEPFNDVAQLVVDLRNGPHRDLLMYPRMRTAMVRFDKETALTFSAGFRTSHSGDLEVRVTPLDRNGTVLGYGSGTAQIITGDVTRVAVSVSRNARPPVEPDGGVGADGPDGGGGGDRPDARLPDTGPPCEPTAPTTTCTGNQTCAVVCSGATPLTTCTMSGPKMPGELCTRTEECVPGSQCFSMTCGMGPQIPKSCLKFCKTDADCGGGRCRTDVPCGTGSTGHRLCTIACDPTGAATGGCAAGLNCFLYSGEVPDCDCRGTTRTGMVGSSCQDSSTCGPGLVCVDRQGARTCRPLCRLVDRMCPAGMVCGMLENPTFSTYGECSPPGMAAARMVGTSAADGIQAPTGRAAPIRALQP